MSLFYLLLTTDDPFNALAKLGLNEMKILIKTKFEKNLRPNFNHQSKAVSTARREYTLMNRGIDNGK